MTHERLCLVFIHLKYKIIFMVNIDIYYTKKYYEIEADKYETDQNEIGRRRATTRAL